MNVMVLMNQSDVNCSDELKIEWMDYIHIYIYMVYPAKLFMDTCEF